jgi:hypothetical protein
VGRVMIQDSFNWMPLYNRVTAVAQSTTAVETLSVSSFPNWLGTENKKKLKNRLIPHPSDYIARGEFFLTFL